MSRNDSAYQGLNMRGGVTSCAINGARAASGTKTVRRTPMHTVLHGRRSCYGFPMESMNDQTGVARVLTDYYTAFSTLNVDAILPFFHEPALLVGPQGVFAAPTSTALVAFFSPAME